MKTKIIIICISLIIPYIATLMCVRHSGSLYKVYEVKDSGYTIKLENGSVDMERFIPMVLMTRMDIDSEEEALKVQAVIIRTFIAGKMEENKTTSISVSDLNLDYLTYDKMKNIWGNDFTKNYNFLNKIISNTSMQVITYEDKLIMPYYHEASYGKTRNSDKEYLKTVKSENDIMAKNFLKIQYFTLDEVNNKIKIDKGKGASNFEFVYNEGTEYVEAVKVGEEEISGSEFVKMFELPSHAFAIEDYEGQLRIISKGIGHGYGVSMYGASVMAEKGNSYETIIKHYFTGVNIAELEV
ncbi:MAG: SpoIID/LytB domain-containing protein [Lachnospiraceae bacterium]|nr:SpoIID/LytB domain-containing protein [Lachnospiraceae bacterium]